MSQNVANIAMNQVRKNVLYELIKQAEKSERHRKEFYEFIARESVVVDTETVAFLIRDANVQVGIGQVFRPEIRSDLIMRPQLREKSVRGLTSYARQWAVFAGAKVFVKLLNKVLVFHNETQAFLVAAAKPPFESDSFRDGR
jgi:hypothetical protein